MECAVCSVQCAVCNIKCAVFSVQCALYRAQCIVYSEQCSVNLIPSLYCQFFTLTCAIKPFIYKATESIKYSFVCVYLYGRIYWCTMCSSAEGGGDQTWEGGS